MEDDAQQPALEAAGVEKPSSVLTIKELGNSEGT